MADVKKISEALADVSALPGHKKIGDSAATKNLAAPEVEAIEITEVCGGRVSLRRLQGPRPSISVS